MKEFLLEMNDYYDVQKLNEDDKISIVVTFLKDHALHSGLVRKSRSLKW